MTIGMGCAFWREGVVTFGVHVYKWRCCWKCAHIASFAKNL